jgi:hypothetical protein
MDTTKDLKGQKQQIRTPALLMTSLPSIVLVATGEVLMNSPVDATEGGEQNKLKQNNMHGS